MSAPKKSKKSRLSPNPQNIDGNNWYYEEPRGIEVVHQVRKDGRLIASDHILIPWRLLRRLLKRREVK